MTSARKPSAPDAKVLNILLGSHRRFLAFLTPRVKTPQDAEEILQAAFGKVIERQPSVDEKMAIPWFFRLLRNALTEYYRRNAAEQRALDNRFAAMDEACEEELERTICQCLGELIPTLKREYAELLVRIDLSEGSGPDSSGNESRSRGCKNETFRHRGRRDRLNGPRQRTFRRLDQFWSPSVNLLGVSGTHQGKRMAPARLTDLLFAAAPILGGGGVPCPEVQKAEAVTATIKAGQEEIVLATPN